MLKFALEMLWTERKKAYGLIVSIVTTLSICLLFLHFIFNPFLTKKVSYLDIKTFGECDNNDKQSLKRWVLSLMINNR